MSNSEVIEEVEYFEVQENFNQNQIVISFSSLSIAPIACKLKIIELQKDGFEEGTDHFETVAAEASVDEDTSLNESLSSVCSSDSFTKDVDSNEYPSSFCSSNSLADDLDMNEYTVSDYTSNLPIMDRETKEQDWEESDQFYKKYTERMRWFDVLNYDRTCGISAILNKQSGTPSFESIEPVCGSLNKMVRKRLLRSLECDFEMVYVGHSCLCWEALHHQYRKVETTLARSSSQDGVFYKSSVTEEFQKFRVLLERFMEDERSCEGKRFWNYVQRRFSLKSLLQVPEISGFFEEEKEGMEGMSAKEVLKAIEKCLETFWVFVKTDNMKSWWKFRSSLWSYPPVEDPRDLELLAYLTKRLQKEIWLKDLQGKKRCWLKRVASSIEESQKKEILFTMIDMKLVARVLQTSVVSSSQLKWCQEKLDNIEFKEGKVMRACNSILFPP